MTGMHAGPPNTSKGPTILLVDDNRDLLLFLERLMAESGWRILRSETASQAQDFMRSEQIDAALFDYLLPDGNGVELACALVSSKKRPIAIVMTGTYLPPEDEALCEEHEIPILRKPFLASDVMAQLRTRLSISASRAADSTASQAGQALKVFVSYSHRDERLRDHLDAHLSPLKRMHIIHAWHDRKIQPGQDFDEIIRKQLNSADLILLLVSPDFLNSEYCYSNEMAHALERHRAGEARVIPVILRPVDWEKAPFAGLQVLPKDGKPVTLWANRDEAFMIVAKSVRAVAEELSATVRRV